MSLRKIATLTILAATMGVAQAATLTHDYELNNSLSDALGGPSLISAGGTLSATGYTFGANQGLSLSNGFANAGDYSIELQFSFDATGDWRKILDFKNLTSDNGLYNLNGALNFYPIINGATNPIGSGTSVNVILTRDGSTNVVVGYVNGVQEISFADSDYAVFDATNGIANFFNDDYQTSQREASSGFVDFIRVYDGPLSSNQARCLSSSNPLRCGIPGAEGNGNVPEPGSLVLFGIALLGIVSRKRWSN